MKYSIIFFIFLLFSAFEVSAAQKDYTGSKITRVYINSGNELLMRVDKADGWLKIGKVGDKRAEMMYSTALAAYLSKSTIWLRIWDHPGTKYDDVRIISLQ